MINDTVDTIVTSKQSRAQNFLDRLKLDQRLMNYNQNPNFDKDFVSVVNLSSASPLHKDYSYLDCVINFAYLLFKNQYALYTVDNSVVGYLSWAWFDRQAEQDFYNVDKIVTDPDIVRSGSQAWIVDVIAPYGHVKQTVRHATAVAHSQSIDSEKVKFQRNYINKSSRRNYWIHR